MHLKFVPLVLVVAAHMSAALELPERNPPYLSSFHNTDSPQDRTATAPSFSGPPQISEEGRLAIISGLSSIKNGVEFSSFSQIPGSINPARDRAAEIVAGHTFDGHGSANPNTKRGLSVPKKVASAIRRRRALARRGEEADEEEEDEDENEDEEENQDATEEASIEDESVVAVEDAESSDIKEEESDENNEEDSSKVGELERRRPLPVGDGGVLDNTPVLSGLGALLGLGGGLGGGGDAVGGDAGGDSLVI